MKITRHRLLAAALAVTGTLAAAPAASAHQTAFSRGIAVTIHVIPDDEPVAGQASSINIVSAKRRGWRFSMSTCRCRVAVSDSSGRVLLNRSVRSRRTAFTFPQRGAYRVRVTGRVTRGRRSRSFNASFTFRAS